MADPVLDKFPPWELVLEMDPADPDSHGAGEAYILIEWLRFWQLLTRDQQAEYLNRWQASPAWRRIIAERYDQYPAEIDLSALCAMTQGNTDETVSSRRPWWRFWR